MLPLLNLKESRYRLSFYYSRQRGWTIGIFIYCDVVTGAFFNSSNAIDNWSGQEVRFVPQRMPRNLSITASILWPHTNCEMPWRLPLQPPRKNTCWIMSFSSAVTSINCEQVPCVWYCMCFVLMSVCLFLSLIRCEFIAFPSFNLIIWSKFFV